MNWKIKKEKDKNRNIVSKLRMTFSKASISSKQERKGFGIWENL
jgi:hypothetical protein